MQRVLGILSGIGDERECFEKELEFGLIVPVLAAEMGDFAVV